MDSPKNKKLFRFFSVTVAIISIALLTVIAFPLIKYANQPDRFNEYIESFGAFKHIAMFSIQISQIIVALIPGEIIEFVAGTVYGWLGGLIFCTIGILLGHTLIFKSVRFFGEPFVKTVAGSKVMNKFDFLKNEKKLKTVLFFLFFIPGTPKDLLTYFVPLTSIKFRDFIIISTLARIPSVISSTYAGDVFAEHDYKTLIIVYSAVLIFTAAGFFIYKITDKKLTSSRSNNKAKKL